MSYERRCCRCRYYLNGRPRQRALVLQWIEESFGSKEPVDPPALTIEHVLLPQTPTATWNAAVAADLGPDESIEGHLYEALVHTLGNLTLTGTTFAVPLVGGRLVGGSG